MIHTETGRESYPVGQVDCCSLHVQAAGGPPQCAERAVPACQLPGGSTSSVHEDNYKHAPKHTRHASQNAARGRLSLLLHVGGTDLSSAALKVFESGGHGHGPCSRSRVWNTVTIHVSSGIERHVLGARLLDPRLELPRVLRPPVVPPPTQQLVAHALAYLRPRTRTPLPSRHLSSSGDAPIDAPAARRLSSERKSRKPASRGAARGMRGDVSIGQRWRCVTPPPPSSLLPPPPPPPPPRPPRRDKTPRGPQRGEMVMARPAERGGGSQGAA